MHKIITLVLLLLISFSLFAAPEKGVTVYVDLSPAGSFEAKTNRVKGGKVIKSGDIYSVKNIHIINKKLKTGIDLRDEHLQKRLGKENVVVLEAKGKNGKGKGKVKINGVTKPFNFNFKVIGKNYLEGEFKIKLSDFKIDDVSYMSVGVKNEINIKVVVPFKSDKTRVRPNKPK